MNVFEDSTASTNPKPIQNQKSALLRTVLVVQWVQFAILLVAFSATAIALTLFALPNAAYVSEKALIFAGISLASGLTSALLFAAIGFIATGEFKILPPHKLRLQRSALVIVPLLSSVVPPIYAVINFAVYKSQQAAASDTEQPLSKVEPAPSTWRHQITDSVYESYKFLATGRVMLRRSFDKPGHPDIVQATAVDGWLVAGAIWERECNPKFDRAEGLTCSEIGISSQFRVPNPEWSHWGTNLHWKMDIDGYKVDINFKTWPLEASRQADAAIKAAGGPIPDPASATVQSAVRFEG